MQVREFINHHFRHFNAATLKDAALAYEQHLQQGGKMLLTLAGAMSTAELGRILAEMIRQDKVHAISCTGANLEEDIFNLVAHEEYLRLPHYRYLTAKDEQALLAKHYNRVTDTCIPEEEAMRKVDRVLTPLWAAYHQQQQAFFPHEPFYQALKQGLFSQYYQIDPQNSWLLAAAEKNLPIVVPGWEDSTLGNFYAAYCLQGKFSSQYVRPGLDYMMALVNWYKAQSASIGFFQIGGGIAGDFPICAVPLMRQDLKIEVPLWGYFCQISDSTTSFGSYSGALPNEKITWEKLAVETPKFIIESDATIVAPLLFQYILEG